MHNEPPEPDSPTNSSEHKYASDTQLADSERESHRTLEDYDRWGQTNSESSQGKDYSTIVEPAVNETQAQSASNNSQITFSQLNNDSRSSINDPDRQNDDPIDSSDESVDRNDVACIASDDGPSVKNLLQELISTIDSQSRAQEVSMAVMQAKIDDQNARLAALEAKVEAECTTGRTHVTDQFNAFKNNMMDTAHVLDQLLQKQIKQSNMNTLASALNAATIRSSGDALIGLRDRVEAIGGSQKQVQQASISVTQRLEDLETMISAHKLATTELSEKIVDMKGATDTALQKQEVNTNMIDYVHSDIRELNGRIGGIQDECRNERAAIIGQQQAFSELKHRLEDTVKWLQQDLVGSQAGFGTAMQSLASSLNRHTTDMNTIITDRNIMENARRLEMTLSSVTCRIEGMELSTQQTHEHIQEAAKQVKSTTSDVSKILKTTKQTAGICTDTHGYLKVEIPHLINNTSIAKSKLESLDKSVTQLKAQSATQLSMTRIGRKAFGDEPTTTPWPTSAGGDRKGGIMNLAAESVASSSAVIKPSKVMSKTQVIGDHTKFRLIGRFLGKDASCLRQSGGILTLEARHVKRVVTLLKQAVTTWSEDARQAAPDGTFELSAFYVPCSDPVCEAYHVITSDNVYQDWVKYYVDNEIVPISSIFVNFQLTQSDSDGKTMNKKRKAPEGKEVERIVLISWNL